MEKKMTALEILIEDLRATHTAIPTNTKENRRVKGAYVDAIQIAKSLLPKEREQIEEAWKNGEHDGYENISASDYFTQKYGHGKD